MVDRADKEKFIDVLLVVMGLILAGASDVQNKLFYYAIFAFIVFAIGARALMTSDSSEYVYSIDLFLIAVSFPIVVAYYFYERLFPNSQVELLSLEFIMFSLIAAAISVQILMSLVDIRMLQSIMDNFKSAWRNKNFGWYKNLLANKQFRLWIALFIFIVIADIIVLSIML